MDFWQQRTCEIFLRAHLEGASAGAVAPPWLRSRWRSARAQRLVVTAPWDDARRRGRIGGAGEGGWARHCAKMPSGGDRSRRVEPAAPRVRDGASRAGSRRQSPAAGGLGQTSPSYAASRDRCSPPPARTQRPPTHVACRRQPDPPRVCRRASRVAPPVAGGRRARSDVREPRSISRSMFSAPSAHAKASDTRSLSASARSSRVCRRASRVAPTRWNSGVDPPAPTPRTSWPRGTTGA